MSGPVATSSLNDKCSFDTPSSARSGQYCGQRHDASQAHLPTVQDWPAGAKVFSRIHVPPQGRVTVSQAVRQEHKRFKAVNVNTLYEHFATLEKLVVEYQLDASRVWNLDDCGVTPGRDANGRSQRRRVIRRNGGRDVRVMPIPYDKRVTFMPVISAACCRYNKQGPVSPAGETGPCLFVFKGKSIPYRVTLVNCTENIDSIANHLPRRAVVTMREEGGGVDQHNFLEWAYHFVVSVQDLTRDGRKVLLIYDGYRSHMSLAVLRLFSQSGIIVYALPSHSFGKTQPLDVVAFACFKRKLNDLMGATVDHVPDAGATVYDLCGLITSAYNSTFTVDIVCSSFRRSGVWPVHYRNLMNAPRPANSTLGTIVGVEEMERMMPARRAELGDKVFGEKVTVLDSGYVDTTKGAVLNTEAALKMVQDRATAQMRAKREAEVLREIRLLRAADRQRRERKEADRIRELSDKRRASMAGLDVVVYKQRLRMMPDRRAEARLRAAKKRAVHYQW